MSSCYAYPLLSFSLHGHHMFNFQSLIKIIYFKNCNLIFLLFMQIVQKWRSMSVVARGGAGGRWCRWLFDYVCWVFL
ncbi:hypothetical protein Hanom_Chr16g01462811 [Helianthus anomalus]